MNKSKNDSMGISSNSSVMDELAELLKSKQEEMAKRIGSECMEAMKRLDNNPERVRQITLAMVAKPGDHRKIGEF